MQGLPVKDREDKLTHAALSCVQLRLPQGLHSTYYYHCYSQSCTGRSKTTSTSTATAKANANAAHAPTANRQ